MTDIITFLLSSYFLIQGAVRGFTNSLMVPFSIIIATIISMIYYQITHEVIISVILALIGPLLLNLLFKFLLKILRKATDKDIKQPLLLSRIGGAALTLSWGWVVIIFTLILLAVLPPWGKTLTAIHEDVRGSMSYIYIAKPFGNIFFGGSHQDTTTGTGNTSNQNVNALAQDPRFQKMLQDPEIQKEIDAHDMPRLMSNPKMIDLVQQIMSDPATMKKVLALYSNQQQPPTNTNP